MHKRHVNSCGFAGGTLIEAAHFAVRYDAAIKRWYQKKCANTLAVVAIKAVAHKLARACYHVMKDGKPLVGLGASWGGFESLVAPIKLHRLRTCTSWSHAGPAVRLHIGLEDPQDLIAGLARSLEVMHALAAQAA